MEVQVLLPAPERPQKQIVLRLFSLLFAPFSLGRQILRHRECLIGQLPVFVVNIQVALEGGFEVDVDG